MTNLIPALVGIFLATLTYAAARSILSRFGSAGGNLVASLFAGVVATIFYTITMQSISEGVTR